MTTTGPAGAHGELTVLGNTVRHAIDHVEVFPAPADISTVTFTNDELNSWLGQARLGLQWLLHRSGPLAVGINQGGCFMRALPEGQRAIR